MERFQGIQLLADSDKLYRHARDAAYRKRAASASVSIELRHDETADRQPLMELQREVDRILARHGVDNQKRFDRIHGRLDLLQLTHQIIIDMKAAGGVENHYIVAVLFRVTD